MNVKSKFLVANPNIKNSLFAKTVIYVFEHNQLGAQGLIINKASDFSVTEVASSCGYDYINEEERVYVGGPVSRRNGFLLHSDEWYSLSTEQIGQRLAITSDVTMFEKMSMGNEPTRWKLTIGMCGWAPEQLDWELEGLGRPHPSWVVCEASPELVYSREENDKLWEQCLETAGQQWVEQHF